MGDQICFSFDKTNREPGEASSQTLRAHLVWARLGFHKLVLITQTHNSNSTITQKLQNFCLVTKPSHKSQLKKLKYLLFAKMVEPTSLTFHSEFIVAARVHFLWPFFHILSLHNPKNRVAYKPKVDLSPPVSMHLHNQCKGSHLL